MQIFQKYIHVNNNSMDCVFHLSSICFDSLSLGTFLHQQYFILVLAKQKQLHVCSSYRSSILECNIYQNMRFIADINRYRNQTTEFQPSCCGTHFKRKHVFAIPALKNSTGVIIVIVSKFLSRLV